MHHLMYCPLPYLYTRVHVIVDVIVFQHAVAVVIEIYTNL